jgi:prevent-host-death family protein
MTQTYSTYEAKTHFSEIIRKVRAGQRIVISHRGREVAEIRPLGIRNLDLAHRLEDLEDEGVLGRHAAPSGPLGPLARKPGALTRFLESRE